MTGVPNLPASVGGAAGAHPADGEAFLAAVAGHAHRAGVAVLTPESGASLTFGALHEASGSLAHRVGTLAPPGSTVVLAAPNGPALVTWFVAGLRAGVRLLLIHPRSPWSEIESLARRAGASALILIEGPAPPAGANLIRIPTDAPASAGAGPPVPCGAVVLPSSGTTDRPKLVLREAAALDADAGNVARATAIGPGDRVLAAMPLSHSYGVDVMLGTLRAGATLVVPCAERFDAPQVAAALEGGVTVFPAVPFMLEALARVGPIRRPPRLRLVFTAGAPLTPAVRAGFEAAWRIPVGQLYGATELGSVTLNDPASPAYTPDAVGRPFPGVSVRILDPEDPRRVRPVGEEGHVAVAAASMLSRYLDGETPLADGHFLTGDLGRVDQAGRLFITGRLKLFIDVGGLKVNPHEIEAALAAHPDVAECVVVPLPLSETVNRVRAVYVPRAGTAPTAESLRTFMKDRLPPHKVPRVFELVAALPRSPSGKILRHEVAGTA